MNRRKYLAQAQWPRVGFETVPSRVGREASDEPSSLEQAWANVRVTDERNYHSTPPSYQTSQAAGAYLDLLCVCISDTCMSVYVHFHMCYA